MELWSWWMLASAVLFLIEIITPGLFFFACLAAGAAAASLGSLLMAAPIFPWFIFVAVSLLSMYTVRPFAKKYFQTHQQKSNIDALVGQKAVVTEPINPPALGTVKVEGETWRAEADECIDAGAVVEVRSVAGTRVKVVRSM